MHAQVLHNRWIFTHNVVISSIEPESSIVKADFFIKLLSLILIPHTGDSKRSRRGNWSEKKKSLSDVDATNNSCVSHAIMNMCGLVFNKLMLPASNM